MNGVERVEYGVEVTWPDGTTEVWQSGLSVARWRVEWHNTPGNSECSARCGGPANEPKAVGVVRRPAVDWQPDEETT